MNRVTTSGLLPALGTEKVEELIGCVDQVLGAGGSQLFRRAKTPGHADRRAAGGDGGSHVGIGIADVEAMLR